LTEHLKTQKKRTVLDGDTESIGKKKGRKGKSEKI